jgi:hypothetical protein
MHGTNNKLLLPMYKNTQCFNSLNHSMMLDSYLTSKDGVPVTGMKCYQLH